MMKKMMMLVAVLCSTFSGRAMMFEGSIPISRTWETVVIDGLIALQIERHGGGALTGHAVVKTIGLEADFPFFLTHTQKTQLLDKIDKYLVHEISFSSNIQFKPDSAFLKEVKNCTDKHTHPCRWWGATEKNS